VRMVLQFVRLHSKSLAKTSRVRQIVLSRKMHYELLSLFSVWFYSILDCIIVVKRSSLTEFSAILSR